MPETVLELERWLKRAGYPSTSQLGALAFLNTVNTPQIALQAVGLNRIQDILSNRILARVSGGPGSPEEATGTQVTALLDAFTSGDKGLAPASGGGTTNFLRADGSWAAPPGGGGGGGDNISVNGVAATDADFDDATPAAPAGGVNVKWQKDASAPDNISAHLAANDVSNTLLADMVQATLKGRATGAGTGDPTDLTAAQATAILDLFTSGLKGLVPASGGGTVNYLRADGSFAVPPGTFVDPWTVLRSTVATSTTLTTGVPVTGLSFTPAANTRYIVDVWLLMQTTVATVGSQPGFSWPTAGVVQNGAWMQAPNSATASAERWWGATATQHAASTGLPAAGFSYFATGRAMLETGAVPVGSFSVSLASETAGTSVSCEAGSVMLYREIP